MRTKSDVNKSALRKTDVLHKHKDQCSSHRGPPQGGRLRRLRKLPLILTALRSGLHPCFPSGSTTSHPAPRTSTHTKLGEEPKLQRLRLLSQDFGESRNGRAGRLPLTMTRAPRRRTEGARGGESRGTGAVWQDALTCCGAYNSGIATPELAPLPLSVPLTLLPSPSGKHSKNRAKPRPTIFNAAFGKQC